VPRSGIGELMACAYDGGMRSFAPSLSLRIWWQARDTVLAWARIFYLGAQVWVLLLSPSTYRWHALQPILQRMYRDTAPILLGFTLLVALICLVITRIVVVTAVSYGLSRYALEMVVRVLVLELIPLTACLFVAMRCTIPYASELALLRQNTQGLRRSSAAWMRLQVLPRVVSGLYASITLAALSCVVALVMAYFGVYGFTWAGVEGYTRTFGQVFNPSVTLVFVLKTWMCSWAVAIIPVSTGMYAAPQRYAARPGDELNGLVRMFAVLLLIEVASLMGNYY
jgi:phospholipid/cholesterol/gamma-HCH transport system permease protein